MTHPLEYPAYTVDQSPQRWLVIATWADRREEMVFSSEATAEQYVDALIRSSNEDGLIGAEMFESRLYIWEKRMIKGEQQ